MDSIKRKTVIDKCLKYLEYKVQTNYGPIKNIINNDLFGKPSIKFYLPKLKLDIQDKIIIQGESELHYIFVNLAKKNYYLFHINCLGILLFFRKICLIKDKKESIRVHIYKNYYDNSIIKYEPLNRTIYSCKQPNIFIFMRNNQYIKVVKNNKLSIKFVLNTTLILSELFPTYKNAHSYYLPFIVNIIDNKSVYFLLKKLFNNAFYLKPSYSNKINELEYFNNIHYYKFYYIDLYIYKKNITLNYFITEKKIFSNSFNLESLFY